MAKGCEVSAYLDFEEMVLYVKKGTSERKFQLIEVNRKALAYVRSKNISSFILKYNGKLYWTKFDPDISFFAKPIFGTHLCSTGRQMCKRFSIPVTEEGYCVKTHTCSGCIENYPGITKGYETIGTRYDCFVVCECAHYLPGRT